MIVCVLLYASEAIISKHGCVMQNYPSHAALVEISFLARSGSPASLLSVCLPNISHWLEHA